MKGNSALGQRIGASGLNSNNLLENSASIFDVFQGANLGLGRKSVAFGLILQHPSRTLKDEEVNTVVNQVVASLQHEFNATLRE